MADSNSGNPSDLHFEGEQLALADELTGQREDVLDHFFGEDRAAGGDPADQRDLGEGAPVLAGGKLVAGAGGAVGQAVGAGAVRVGGEVALAFQGLELVGDG